MYQLAALREKHVVSERNVSSNMRIIDRLIGKKYGFLRESENEIRVFAIRVSLRMIANTRILFKMLIFKILHPILIFHLPDFHYW